MSVEKGIQQEEYFHLSLKKVIEALSVDQDQGLSEKEVEKRRKKFGRNVLPEKGKGSVIKLFFKQFKDFLILILFIAAGIAWYADQMADVWIILGIILFNAIMGFVQEYRAEKAIESIKNMIKHKATVLRDGEKKQVLASEVVIGDIIHLNEGETIPADGRLLESKNLRTSEASLTGESEPVNKNPESLEKETTLAERKNMVFKGTHIARGAGKAVVTAVGEETEIGKIAESLQKMEKTGSNFKRKTARLARTMAIIAVSTSLVVFTLGYFWRDFSFNEILLVTIATLVSSIPEGLPVVISITLAIGANRMARKNAIIREFTATEMLGSVSTILTDKTGTLTQSILTVKKLFTGDRHDNEVEGQGYDLEGKILAEEEGSDCRIRGKIH